MKNVEVFVLSQVRQTIVHFAINHKLSSGRGPYIQGVTKQFLRNAPFWRCDGRSGAGGENARKWGSKLHKSTVDFAINHKLSKSGDIYKTAKKELQTSSCVAHHAVGVMDVGREESCEEVRENVINKFRLLFNSQLITNCPSSGHATFIQDKEIGCP